MKILKCHSCGEYLGEIEKGKIKNGSAIFCHKCLGNMKLLSDLDEYKKGTVDGRGKDSDGVDFLKGMFNMK